MKKKATWLTFFLVPWLVLTACSDKPAATPTPPIGTVAPPTTSATPTKFAIIASNEDAELESAGHTLAGGSMIAGAAYLTANNPDMLAVTETVRKFAEANYSLDYHTIKGNEAASMLTPRLLQQLKENGVQQIVVKAYKDNILITQVQGVEVRAVALSQNGLKAYELAMVSTKYLSTSSAMQQHSYDPVKPGDVRTEPVNIWLVQLDGVWKIDNYK